jgi:hypothetical protein
MSEGAVFESTGTSPSTLHRLLALPQCTQDTCTHEHCSFASNRAERGYLLQCTQRPYVLLPVACLSCRWRSHVADRGRVEVE